MAIKERRATAKLRFDKKMLLAGALLLGVGIWSLYTSWLGFGITMNILGTILLVAQGYAYLRTK